MSFVSSVTEIVQKNKFVQIALVIVAIYLLMQFLGPKKEGLENIVTAEQAKTIPTYVDIPVSAENLENVHPNASLTHETLSPNDLLPKAPLAEEFAAQFPSGGQEDLATKNFLTAGFNVGINTIASSLRNANTQLRSDPFIPMNHDVSPWNVSTISPDLNRKPLDIGTTC